MTSKVIYKGSLRTEATHVRSGSMIETDAPVDNKGKGARFSPTDLVAAALATCMLTTMAIAADTHSISMDGTTCYIEKIMAAEPRRISELKAEIRFPQGMMYSDKDKKILEHAANNCPVTKSLHPDLQLAISFLWAGTEEA